MKKNKKGFTLAELLIAVAIIGVLVAISIPIFNNQLRKARLATNQANARAAYAAWVAQYIDEGMPQGVRYYTYHTSTGKLENMGAINFGCAVSRDWYANDPITNISEWKIGTHANITDRTLGSDVYEYWQMQVIDGKVMAYYALRNPAKHYQEGCTWGEKYACDTQYTSVLKALADGKESHYEQKQMRMIRDEERLQDPNTPWPLHRDCHHQTACRHQYFNHQSRKAKLITQVLQ